MQILLCVRAQAPPSFFSTPPMMIMHFKVILILWQEGVGKLAHVHARTLFFWSTPPMMILHFKIILISW
jgi:hypothetical protein